MNTAVSGPSSYVRRDADGVFRVTGTPVSLDSVVVAFEHGESPESISQAYPALSLEQVYGAITYYLAHEQEVDAYLRERDQVWQRERARSERDNAPFLARLRRLKSESHSSTSPASEATGGA